MAFPIDFKQRETYILEAVKAGKVEYYWAPIVSYAGENEATFYVTTDALKIEGVRVNVSATLQQQIADLLDAMLLTPKLADLRFHAAEQRLLPQPRPITNDTAVMIQQSAKIDKLIKSKAYAADKIIDTVGKHWCISNELKSLPSKMAMNYGWHFAGGSTMQGIKGHPCDSKLIDPVSKIVYHTIQPSATAHDRNHSDYSQICILVKKDCIVNGQPARLDQILQDKNLAMLGSHEGPLAVLRQNGVPELDPLKDLDTPVGPGPTEPSFPRLVFSFLRYD